MADEAKRYAIMGVEVRADGARIFAEEVSSQFGFFLRSVPVGWIACDDAVARWLENRQRTLVATHKILADATGCANDTVRLAEILVERQQRYGLDVEEAAKARAEEMAADAYREIEKLRQALAQSREATDTILRHDLEVEKRISKVRSDYLFEIAKLLGVDSSSGRIPSFIEDVYAAIRSLLADLKKSREEGKALEKELVRIAGLDDDVEWDTATVVKGIDEGVAEVKKRYDALRRDLQAADRAIQTLRGENARLEKERDRAMTSLMSWGARFESLVDAWAGSADRTSFASSLVKTRAWRIVGAFLADLVKAATETVSGLLALSG